jgi:thiamine-phosphate pyrophosphorylase
VSPLYAIVDVEVCLAAGRDPALTGEGYLAAGVSMIQVRAKRLASGDLLALVDRLAPVAVRLGATLIVNDRVDVARTVGLGVHLGQTDLPVVDARAILGPNAVIGHSTHTRAELTAALEAPSTYVAYGPVFATRTKANPDPVVGLAGVAEAAALAHAAGRRLVAIGGITLDTAPAVVAAGADAAAVIGDLVHPHEDAEARARRFLRALAAKPV